MDMREALIIVLAGYMEAHIGVAFYVATHPGHGVAKGQILMDTNMSTQSGGAFLTRVHAHPLMDLGTMAKMKREGSSAAEIMAEVERRIPAWAR